MMLALDRQDGPNRLPQMRFHRHDVRDLKLAFALGFDVRRILSAGLALFWTLFVVAAVFGVLSWRHDGQAFSGDGLTFALASLKATDNLPLRLVWWGMVLGAWWVGFAYLCAPILRSAAFDIARDERERNPSVPLLNRQAALSPLLGMVLPGVCFLVLLLWALASLIPGNAGALVSAVLLIPAFAFAAFGAVTFLLVVFAAPMMAPAAVTEGRDYFEAFSRPVSYVMQQPGRYIGYMLAKCFVTLVSGAVGALVLLVAWGLVALALMFVGLGPLVTEVATELVPAGGETDTLQPASLHASLIALLFITSVANWLAWLMVVALSADQIVYMLMRYNVDGVPFNAITVAEDKLQNLPTAVETAEEAEEARKRNDALQEKKTDAKTDEKPEPEAKPESETSPDSAKA
jgi:hypothetical protein